MLGGQDYEQVFCCRCHDWHSRRRHCLRQPRRGSCRACRSGPRLCVHVGRRRFRRRHCSQQLGLLHLGGSDCGNCNRCGQFAVSARGQSRCRRGQDALAHRHVRPLERHRSLGRRPVGSAQLGHDERAHRQHCPRHSWRRHCQITATVIPFLPTRSGRSLDPSRSKRYTPLALAQNSPKSILDCFLRGNAPNQLLWSASRQDFARERVQALRPALVRDS